MHLIPYLYSICLNDISKKKVYTCVMYLFTPYLYSFMSLWPADVPGYKRRKGICFEFSIKEGYYKRISAKECAKRCNDREECRAFLYNSYDNNCSLKPRSCETLYKSTDRFFYDRCKSFEADMMFFIFCS